MYSLPNILSVLHDTVFKCCNPTTPNRAAEKESPMLNRLCWFNVVVDKGVSVDTASCDTLCVLTPVDQDQHYIINTLTSVHHNLITTRWC